MIRGTTPTHVFQLPFETKLLKEVRISYAQDNKIVMEKKTEDCKMEGDTISVTLSQEETLLFSHGSVVELQLKVSTEAGNCLATPIIRKHIDEILNQEVL
jgi:hypothetical protein